MANLDCCKYPNIENIACSVHETKKYSQSEFYRLNGFVQNWFTYQLEKSFVKCFGPKQRKEQIMTISVVINHLLSTKDNL